MRSILPPKLEDGRVRTGKFASSSSFGPNGAFFIFGPKGAELKIIASDASHPESEGWEHVSISVCDRCPNWEEMCFVKDLFWDEEEVVVQFHPARNDYVNIHPYCLHLFRYVREEIRMPPSILVGPKGILDKYLDIWYT